MACSDNTEHDVGLCRTTQHPCCVDTRYAHALSQGPMQRTEDEILAVAEGARFILTDETFNTLFKEFSDQSLAAIVGSQPHESKLREFEYTKLQALIGFSNYLAGFVEAAQNIINKNAPQQSDED